jgi:hypothetical protein
LEIDGTDIPDCWALTPADLVLVMAKNEANRVDFALLLLFYPRNGSCQPVAGMNGGCPSVLPLRKR